MNIKPIFIHSLFRSGSTYLFDVFRRSKKYWCYQEPLHEVVFESRNCPDKLLAITADKLNLRHPKLKQPYFYEVFDVWPSWKNFIMEEAIYQNYFSNKEKEIGIEYFKTLIHSAKARAVFQECRTSMRINPIKQELGGFHIYLWRNPWDQWWSYKINDYFDAINQIILSATDLPLPIQLLVKMLGLEICSKKSVSKKISFYLENPKNSEESYLVFYMLWCLSLKHGVEFSDLLINIDLLTNSIKYQKNIKDQLQKQAISEIDFSDCLIPQSKYLAQDEEFFLPLENQIHNLLIEGGWSENEITVLLEKRKECQPASKNDYKQAVQARTIARKFQNNFSAALKNKRLPDLSISEGLELYSEFYVPINSAAGIYYLNKGFHDPESFGVWSKERSSLVTMPIKIPIDHFAIVTVSFNLGVYERLIAESPVLHLYTKDKSVGYVFFRSNTSYVEISFDLEVYKSPIEIYFEFTNLESPKKFGSIDQRYLGFNMTKAHFSYKSNKIATDGSRSNEAIVWGV